MGCKASQETVNLNAEETNKYKIAEVRDSFFSPLKFQQRFGRHIILFVSHTKLFIRHSRDPK